MTMTDRACTAILLAVVALGLVVPLLYTIK